MAQLAELLLNMTDDDLRQIADMLVFNLSTVVSPEDMAEALLETAQDIA